MQMNLDIHLTRYKPPRLLNLFSKTINRCREQAEQTDIQDLLGPGYQQSSPANSPGTKYLRKYSQDLQVIKKNTFNNHHNGMDEFSEGQDSKENSNNSNRSNQSIFEDKLESNMQRRQLIGRRSGNTNSRTKHGKKDNKYPIVDVAGKNQTVIRRLAYNRDLNLSNPKDNDYRTEQSKDEPLKEASHNLPLTIIKSISQTVSPPSPTRRTKSSKMIVMQFPGEGKAVNEK